jgi:hypothetical protein
VVAVVLQIATSEVCGIRAPKFQRAAYNHFDATNLVVSGLFGAGFFHFAVGIVPADG